MSCLCDLALSNRDSVESFAGEFGIMMKALGIGMTPGWNHLDGTSI